MRTPREFPIRTSLVFMRPINLAQSNYNVIYYKIPHTIKPRLNEVVS